MTCIYLNWLCRSRAGDWDPINRFHPSACCCLSQTRISMSIDICRVCFFALNDVRWEKDARCVDTGGIVDHHSLNLLYMTYACTINAKQKSINQSINQSQLSLLTNSTKVSIPSQESERSCICVLGVSVHTKPGKWAIMYLCARSIGPYQARKMSGHVFVC